MAVLVDTSAWVALIFQRDQNHQPAREFFRTIATSTPLITTNYILSETFTWFAHRRYHAGVVEVKGMIDAGLRVGSLMLEWIGPAVHADAWRIFEASPGLALSSCDCASFVVARDHQVDYVFTFDSDFRNMGFEVRP